MFFHSSHNMKSIQHRCKCTPPHETTGMECINCSKYVIDGRMICLNHPNFLAGKTNINSFMLDMPCIETKNQYIPLFVQLKMMNEYWRFFTVEETKKFLKIFGLKSKIRLSDSAWAQRHEKDFIEIADQALTEYEP